MNFTAAADMKKLQQFANKNLPVEFWLPVPRRWLHHHLCDVQFQAPWKIKSTEAQIHVWKWWLLMIISQSAAYLVRRLLPALMSSSCRRRVPAGGRFSECKTQNTSSFLQIHCKDDRKKSPQSENSVGTQIFCSIFCPHPSIFPSLIQSRVIWADRRHKMTAGETYWDKQPFTLRRSKVINIT